jgi:FAD/FMN-containing dehydrogenase
VNLTGWGRYPRLEAEIFSFEEPESLREYLHQEGETIVYALGRSYGDSALNNKVVFSRRFNNVLQFDPRDGVITCESGVSLAELIDAFLPRGWFLAVTPGTRFITVGGAIASDVHGKNHHREGCFSQCVHSLELMLPDGEIVRCSRQENKELFLATCGGMGLTGVILTATFRLQRISSAYIAEKTFKAGNLEELLNLFEEYQKIPYSVAWIDCLTAGEELGRGLLMVGDLAENRPLDLPPSKPVSLPFDLPGFCLNKFSMGIFNHLFYGRVSSIPRERVIHLLNFFYPLDAILHWNRLYGSRGFTQYQLVLPKAAGYQGLTAILQEVAQSGLGAFLGTLKLFGPENENFLSFPREGYTLAMDFKIQEELFPFLDKLDRVVLDHGGRLYLTKDVRMGPRVFRQGYPKWAKFGELREKMGLTGKFHSLQSKRLGI